MAVDSARGDLLDGVLQTGQTEVGGLAVELLQRLQLGGQRVVAQIIDNVSEQPPVSVYKIRLTRAHSVQRLPPTQRGQKGRRVAGQLLGRQLRDLAAHVEHHEGVCGQEVELRRGFQSERGRVSAYDGRSTLYDLPLELLVIT